MRVCLDSKLSSIVEAHIEGLDINKIKSFPSIKKIAEDKDVCVFIKKVSDNRQIDNKNIFVMALVYRLSSLVRGASHIVISKNCSNEELSVKIYNTVMNAISEFENKSKIIK